MHLEARSQQAKINTLKNNLIDGKHSEQSAWHCAVYMQFIIIFYYSQDPEKPSYRKSSKLYIHQRCQSSDSPMIFFQHGTENSQKGQAITTLSHLLCGYDGCFS